MVNKELEAFTYSVSHDLRAPLRHIDGFSKILVDESESDLSEFGKRAVERIRFGAQQMGRMIDDLLEFSRLGRKDVARRPTDLRGLVDESVEILKPAMEARDIDLRIGGLPVLECDPALLKHVMVNLLSNAIKFTRDSKPAVIEVGQVTAQELTGQETTSQETTSQETTGRAATGQETAGAEMPAPRASTQQPP